LQFKVIKKTKKKKKDITSYDNLRVVCIYIYFSLNSMKTRPGA